MAIQASRRLEASPQQVWDILRNPEMLRRVLPGLEQIESEGSDGYRWAAELQAGAQSERLQGQATLAAQQPAQAALLRLQGQSAAGVTWQGSLQLQLAALGGLACNLAVTLQVSASGLDQKTAQGLASAWLEDFLARLGVAAKLQNAPPSNEAEEEFATTLMGEAAPQGRAGSALYQDDKKFPTWVWPLLALLLLGLWWLGK